MRFYGKLSRERASFRLFFFFTLFSLLFFLFFFFFFRPFFTFSSVFGVLVFCAPMADSLRSSKTGDLVIDLKEKQEESDSRHCDKEASKRELIQLYLH